MTGPTPATGVWTWEPATGAVTGDDGVTAAHGSTEPVRTYDALLALVHPTDRGRVADAWAAVAGGGPAAYELYRTTGGGLVGATARSVPTAAGVLVVGSMTAVREPRPDRLRQMDLSATGPLPGALHDALTGLPGRRLLLDHLEAALARSAKEGRDVAVLLLGIDGLGRVNRSLGHEAGDALLVHVAAAVAAELRAGDRIGRIGGDEFAVVCEGLQDEPEVRTLAGRILDAVALPVDIDGQPVVVSASIGIARPSGQPVRPPDLLRAAAAAMARAKAEGRARFVVSEPGVALAGDDRMALEAGLRRAIPEGQFLLHYQPIARTDGTLLGVEALLRWQHPDRGLLSPGDFLALVPPDLARDMTAWVLGRAIGDAAAWAGSGADAVTVSVNVSADELRTPGFADLVVGLLREGALPPAALVLEIVEDELADTEAVVAEVGRLRDLGIGLAVDDFGTGYSSLAYLRRLPITAVKVDGSFIGPVAENPVDASLVRAVVDVCRAAGCTSVAEGVETLEQLTALRAIGCDAVQGSLAGVAVALEELLPVLTAGRVALPDDQA